MGILIVDSSPACRSMVRRILIRDLGFTVTEAADGLEALELLANHRYSLVLLDLDLPVLDGLRVLEILREAPDEAAVPVVVLSARNDEATVRQCVQLNVGAFIAKPVDPATLATRLSRLAKRLRLLPPAQAPEQGDTGEDTPPRGAMLRVLVADGDPEFRQFVSTVLQAHVRSVPASTGTEALRLCLTSAPDVALIGHNLGLLKSNMLVGELRRQPRLRSMRIFAVAPKNLVEGVLATAPYDGVLARTYLPGLFLDQFRQLVNPPGAVARVLALYPPLGENMISAVHQVCGIMLGTEVDALVEPLERSELGVQASIVMTAAAQGLALRFNVWCNLAGSQWLASRLLNTNVDAVTDEDVTAAMCELANIITGRLRTSLADRGIAVACSIPESRMRQLEEPQAQAIEDGVRFQFRAVDRSFVLEVALRGMHR